MEHLCMILCAGMSNPVANCTESQTTVNLELNVSIILWWSWPLQLFYDLFGPFPLGVYCSRQRCQGRKKNHGGLFQSCCSSLSFQTLSQAAVTNSICVLTLHRWFLVPQKWSGQYVSIFLWACLVRLVSESRLSPTALDWTKVRETFHIPPLHHLEYKAPIQTIPWPRRTACMV